MQNRQKNAHFRQEQKRPGPNQRQKYAESSEKCTLPTGTEEIRAKSPTEVCIIAKEMHTSDRDRRDQEQITHRSMHNRQKNAHFRQEQKRPGANHPHIYKQDLIGILIWFPEVTMKRWPYCPVKKVPATWEFRLGNLTAYQRCVTFGDIATKMVTIGYDLGH